METAFVITSDVINTINALPEKERVAVASALAAEMILGAKTDGGASGLTPVEEMLYSMIKGYVRRDTERSRRIMYQAAFAPCQPDMFSRHAV